MAAGGHQSLDPSDCLRLLGLPGAASPAQIKRAYRRLAQRFHPDKAGADDAARRHFEVISNAYRCLMQVARLVEKGQPVGRCAVCGEFGEVIVGLDGHGRCPVCVLRPGGRPRLPLPPLVVVKCVTASLLLVVAVVLLVRSVTTSSLVCAVWGTAAGATALASLAWISLSVLHCAHPHRSVEDGRVKRRMGW